MARRRLAALDAAAIAAITITNAVLAWPLRGIIDRPEIPDPELAARFDLLNAVYLPEVAIVAALTVASFGSLIVRYRRVQRRRPAPDRVGDLRRSRSPSSCP